MDPRDRDAIAARYTQRYKQFGGDIRALATGTPARQALRFEILASLGDLHGASVLDIGCGLASFYQFLNDRGVAVDYIGYDICPEFIERAQSLYPAATFEVRDVHAQGIAHHVDYAVCSQVFNNRLDHADNFDVAKQVLEHAYTTVRRGVAMDMLTSYVDFREDRLYYFSPEDVFRFCKSLTKRVVLRHDYPLYEFAVFLYPDFSGWRAETNAV